MCNVECFCCGTGAVQKPAFWVEIVHIVMYSMFSTIAIVQNVAALDGPATQACKLRRWHFCAMSKGTAYFWPLGGVRSMTSTHASGALHIGRFQLSYVTRRFRPVYIHSLTTALTHILWYVKEPTVHHCLRRVERQSILEVLNGNHWFMRNKKGWLANTFQAHRNNCRMSGDDCLHKSQGQKRSSMEKIWREPTWMR